MRNAIERKQERKKASKQERYVRHEHAKLRSAPFSR